MRTTRLLFPILMLTAACAGASARKDVLLPALRGEWPHVRELAVRGDAQIAPTAARMDGALAVGDRPTIAATWPPIETAALAGVQAGQRGASGPFAAWPASGWLAPVRKQRYRQGFCLREGPCS